MHTDAWLSHAWQDRRLTWNKDSLGISVMRVPSSKIWLPDITLHNSADQEKRMKCLESNALIFYTGTIVWVPTCHLESYCNLTLPQEPYKEQLCLLKFGSWFFDGLTLGLDFYKAEKQANLDDYKGAKNKYEITSNTALRTEKKFDCCKEPYLGIAYTLGLTRWNKSSKKGQLYRN